MAYMKMFPCTVSSCLHGTLFLSISREFPSISCRPGKYEHIPLFCQPCKGSLSWHYSNKWTNLWPDMNNFLVDNLLYLWVTIPVLSAPVDNTTVITLQYIPEIWYIHVTQLLLFNVKFLQYGENNSYNTLIYPCKIWDIPALGIVWSGKTSCYATEANKSRVYYLGSE